MYNRPNPGNECPTQEKLNKSKNMTAWVKNFLGSKRLIVGLNATGTNFPQE